MSTIATFSQIPQCLTSVEDVKMLLDLVHNCCICRGNSDEKFMVYIMSKNRKIMNASGTVDLSAVVIVFIALT